MIGAGICDLGLDLGLECWDLGLDLGFEIEVGILGLRLDFWDLVWIWDWNFGIWRWNVGIRGWNIGV